MNGGFRLKSTLRIVSHMKRGVKGLHLQGREVKKKLVKARWLLRGWN